MPRTRVIIGRNGKVSLEGIGYVGEDCIRDLKIIIERLKRYGVEVKIEDLKRKPEATRSAEGAIG